MRLLLWSSFNWSFIYLSRCKGFCVLLSGDSINDFFSKVKHFNDNFLSFIVKSKNLCRLYNFRGVSLYSLHKKFNFLRIELLYLLQIQTGAVFVGNHHFKTPNSFGSPHSSHQIFSSFSITNSYPLFFLT